ncbi:MAG: glycosyltransferase [Bacteroidetes bacterium]|nr:glycosyltransferase [Bacteroidota bacterium]
MKLSIITINLNNNKGLAKTLASIFSQSFLDYETILIDGDSNDDSVKTIKRFEHKLNYWTSEPDSGIYHAMNKGIKKACGEYCYFLNSGDYFVDENVLKRVFLENHNFDIIQGNLKVCIKGNVIGVSRGRENLTFLDIYSSKIKHQASFINRKLFEEFGSYNEDLKIVSDFEFFMKTIGFEGVSYKYIDVDISYFDNDGLSNKNPEMVLTERNMVLNNYLPPLMQEDYKSLQKLKYFEVLLHYKITYLILRILNKLIKMLKHYKIFK